MVSCCITTGKPGESGANKTHRPGLIFSSNRVLGEKNLSPRKMLLLSRGENSMRPSKFSRPNEKPRLILLRRWALGAAPAC